MYIDAEEVKNSMDLNIHQQIADFINKSVNDSQTMYLEDLENDLESLLEQEKIGNTISDVGIGIELALKKVWELLDQFKKEQPENDTRWISCEKRYPKREGASGTTVEREVRIADKKANLELLGKHLGMFRDKVELEGSLESVTIINDIPREIDGN